MRVKRYTFVFVVLSVLFLSLDDVKAQTAVSYRFLEVVDTAGKPVADAQVEPIGSNSVPLKTDESGLVRNFPVYYGDFNTRGVKISKPGYFSYEDKRLFTYYYSPLLSGENIQHDPRAPIRIELLKMPATPAERKAVEAEQRKRELLMATKHGDAATVRRLLQTGVGADTTDAHGIPAVLWAATTGEAETLKALLAAGADVRSKGKRGRKALLYYLRYTVNGVIDEELVRSLLKAGASVDAVDSNGTTALMLAKQTGNARIIKLLESAAQRRR